MTRMKPMPAVLAKMLSEATAEFLRVQPGPLDVADWDDALLQLDEAVQAAITDVRRRIVAITNEALVGDSFQETA